jgi:ribosomal protein L7/L12
MALFGNSDGDQQRRIDELEQRVAALERAVRQHGWALSGPPAGEPSAAWASDEVRRLAMSGKKIEAIKVLRDETGMDLKQAKGIVDRLY